MAELESIFDGSASDATIINFCEKIEAGKIDLDELKDQININASLFSALHKDVKGKEIFDTICHTPSGDNLSSRIILKIDQRKKKSKFKSFFLIAALLLLSLGLWQFNQISQPNQPIKINYVNAEYEKYGLNNQLSNHRLIFDKKEVLETNEIGVIKNSRGSKISLASNTSFSMNDTTFQLYTGKIFADIAHHDLGVPLQFRSDQADIKILGTKFLLQYAKQNNRGKTLLVLKKGKVSFKLNGKSTILKSGQYLLADHLSGNVIFGQHNKMIKLNGENKSRDLVYQSPKSYEWIPLFWNSWTKDTFSISKNKKRLNIKTSFDKEIIVRSKSFCHYPKFCRYKIFVEIPIEKGAIEVYLKFYRNDKINFSIANKVSVINGELIVQQKKRGRKGELIETKKTYGKPKGFEGITFNGDFTKYKKIERESSQHANITSPLGEMHFELSVIALEEFVGTVKIKNVRIETYQ